MEDIVEFILKNPKTTISEVAVKYFQNIFSYKLILYAQKKPTKQ